MSAPYYIGIDGGGSNSRLAAIDAKMNLLGSFLGGATNPSSMTFESLCETISNLLNGFTASSGLKLEDCAGMYIGAAGARVPGNAQKLIDAFNSIGYTGNLSIVSDAEIVLAGETHGEPGMIIISGTGSVGFATDNRRKLLRVGGRGHLIDDGGSGYRIGMDGIKAAFLDYDGVGQKTGLTKLALEHFNVQALEDVLPYIYGKLYDKAQIAGFAMSVKLASQQGDTVAKEIEIEAASNLIVLAKALIKKSELFNGKLVISGSVIVNNKFIRELFTHALSEEYPNVKIAEVSQKPEIGAAYLALREYAE